MDRIKFFRRRQFVLGPSPLPYEGWNRHEIDSGHVLTIHPDLSFYTKESIGMKAVLLGYCIDPLRPETGETEIIERFLGSVSFHGIVQELKTLSGRFVLILKRHDGMRLFHDAVALRQVNYCKTPDGNIWCASQPEVIAEQLNFNLDEEVLDFRNTSYKLGADESWLQNDRTPYKEIRNLLPNHYLDLRTGEAHRYWPTESCLDSLSIKKSNDLCAKILQGSIRAAANKFDLHLGVSGGGDSRKTLAASRDVIDKIYLFTHTPTQKSQLISDIKVPAQLLNKLGLKHHIIELKKMSPAFKSYFDRNVIFAREKRGNIAFTLLNHFGPNSTVMNSNISEVAQCVYWIPASEINGLSLAVISGLNHPFAISEFQKWLDGAVKACSESRVNILDLFFLEQRMGRWATAAFSEYDIAHETFNPYNNRHLHCLMLSVDERHRKNRRWNVLIEQIKLMWPEVLCEPINPQDHLTDQLKQMIRRNIVHKFISPWLPVYEYLRYKKLKKRFIKQKSGN